MKVLWLCNTLLPHASEKLGMKANKPESWINGIYHQLEKEEDIQLIYLFPYGNNKSTIIGNTTFLSYKEDSVHGFSESQITEFEKILEEQKPDVIHIFGTEYPHAYTMATAAEHAGLIDRVVINIQGLSTYCGRHHDAFLPSKVLHGFTIKDIIRKNVYFQKKDFLKRSKYEQLALKKVKHVIGRTDWDRACVERANPDVQYYTCNEILRPAFYNKSWSLDGCEKHSVFVSQCAWPLKGFHLMLEAMDDLKKWYPDVHLYTTGVSPFASSFKQKIRQSYYNLYLGKLMKKYHLEEHVTFLGYLTEEEMCERFLKSHVFANCSSIENESNSLSEAKILGVPAVASYVGGVTNRITHKVDGFLYPADEPYMLAYYIKQIFESDELAAELSAHEKEAVKDMFTEAGNYQVLKEIYRSIAK